MGRRGDGWTSKRHQCRGVKFADNRIVRAPFATNSVKTGVSVFDNVVSKPGGRPYFKGFIHPFGGTYILSFFFCVHEKKLAGTFICRP